MSKCLYVENPVKKSIIPKLMEAKSTLNQRILLGLLFAFCILPIALFSQTTVPFTSTTTWTCPYGVTSVTVKCWGGGGSGGGEVSNTADPGGSGGGAGGAYAEKVVTVTPGTTYTVTVGATKTGTTSAGAQGNPTWFSTSGTVYAEGGAGGGAATTSGASGGVGSSAASIGDPGLVFAGGNGANGTGSGGIGGAGGGGAGSTGAGGNASGTTAGTGTSSNGGNGGTGVSSTGGNGAAGSTYGGGGSGSYNNDNTDRTGGSGAAGYLTITYTGVTQTLRIGASGDDFTSITAAADALEAAGVAAPIILEIQSDYAEASETYPITMTAISGTTATNTVIYRPASGVTALVSDADAGSTNALITFNGADYIIFDGRAAGSGSTQWTIRNTNQNATASNRGAVFKFISDATYNTLRYCNIEADSYTDNGIIWFSTATTNGNDNNTLSYCKIQNYSDATYRPGCGVYSSGTTGQTNSSNTVDNCEFVDIWNSASSVTSTISMYAFSDTWTISNNHFYQTTSFSDCNNSSYFIYIDNGNSYTITGNYFGGQATSCGGSAFSITSGTGIFYGIFFTSNVSGGSNTINGNRFGNISYTSTYSAAASHFFFGLVVNGGNSTYTIGQSGSGNIFGATSGTGSIVATNNAGATSLGFCGIRFAGTGTATIAYNDFGAITAAGNWAHLSTRLISIISGSVTVDNNNIGNTTADNIVGSSDADFTGIRNESTSGATITNNTFRNWDYDANTATLYGISNTAGDLTCTGNSFQGISLGGTSSNLYAIYSSSTGTINISSNTIGSATNNNISIASNNTSYGIRVLGTPLSLTANSNTIQEFNLTNTGTAAIFYGIYVSTATASAATINSNVITNIDNAGTNGGTVIRGIYFTAGITGVNMNSNRITYLNATTAGASSPVVYGISITSATSGGNLKKNFIADLTNTATSSPVIDCIYLLGSWSVHNNVVLVSNGSNTNNVTIRGLRDLSTGTVTVYHNTVKISGSASAGSLASYAYHREGTPTPTSITVKNNIFQNLRTGGTGDHNAYYAQEISGLTTDYNYLQVSADANKLGNWNGTNKTFAAWQADFSGEDNSQNSTVSINSTGGATTNTAYLSELGETLGDVTDDINGLARGVNSWIGAIEGASYLKWTGVNNTDWNTGSNWFSGTKPTSSDEVKITSGWSNYPNIDEADAVCSALIVDNGASLTVSSGELTVGGKFDWDGAMTMTGGTLDVNGEIELSATMTETISGGTIECSGAWSGSSDDGGFTPTGGTVVMDGGASSNISNHANGTFYNLTIDRSGQVVTQTSSHTLLGVLTITAGTLSGNGNNLTVAGNWANSGTFTAGSGTVTFNGTSTISGSSTTSFNNLTISGTLTGASSANFNVAGNWVNSAGTFTHNSGTVTFNGSGAQTVTTGGVGGTKQFYNVTINNTDGSPGDANDVDADAIYVGGTLTVTDGQFQPATTSDFVAVTVSTNGILKADASATITISGDYSNSGTFTHNNGTVTFDNAGAAQAIGGSSTSTFYNCIVDNGSTGVTLNRGIQVNVTLTMTDGNINLNGFNIDLSTAGVVSGETNDKRIYGTSGTVIAQDRTLSASTPYTDIAGLGINITTGATAPGVTDITRGHAAQTNGVKTSINRYYDIDPTTNTTLDATLRFYYYDNEMNGQSADEADFALYRSTDVGSTWTVRDGTVTAGSNYIELASIAAFSRWTVSGKTNNPLPVSLLEFTAIAKDNSVEVKWSTSAEINNDYFTIERTQDGQNFEEVAVVEGAGNSNQTLNYVSLDNQPFSGTSYYRLKQTDFDGKFEYFNMIPVSFGAASIFEFNISPNPIGTYQAIKIQLLGQGNETVNVRVNDMFGKEVFKNSVQMDRKEKTVNIASNDALSSGVYFIICEVNGTVSSKKLVVR